MTRRALTTLFGGAVATRPHAAHVQQARKKLGALHPGKD
jgi:hypothetical protein